MLVFNGNKQKTDIPHLDTIHCILPSGFRVWFGGRGLDFFFQVKNVLTESISFVIICKHLSFSFLLAFEFDYLL